MAEPAIQLDRTKPYSECHGERTPDDPHYKVHFWQGGEMLWQGKKIKVLLPFDGQGDLVLDDGKTEKYQGAGFDPQGKPALVFYSPLYTPEMRAYRDAKLKRMAAVTASSDAIVDEDEPAESVQSLANEVNFAAWLRGEAKYQPHLLRAAARERFKKTYTSIPELVADLVLDERIVPEDEVCAALAKNLPARQAA